MIKTLTGIVAAAVLAGCAGPSYAQEGTPPSLLGESLRGKASKKDRKPKTPTLQRLQDGKNYVVLIDAYDTVKRLSELVGFSGNYGHIEVVRNGISYGCRPPECSEISLVDLEQKFHGSGFEIREIDIKGDPERAVRWFRQNLEGQAYNLLDRNCTDAVVLMYDASGDRTRRLDPVDVDRTYVTNEPLRRFMAENGIPKPNREEVFFPDQFTTIGSLVAKGRFVGR